MAVRDAALEKKHSKVVDSCHEILFSDTEAAQAWMTEVANSETSWEDIFNDGVELKFAKLIPSLVDRKPFFEYLTLGPI